jgi:hypothetical protein
MERNATGALDSYGSYSNGVYTPYNTLAAYTPITQTTTKPAPEKANSPGANFLLTPR